MLESKSSAFPLGYSPYCVINCLLVFIILYTILILEEVGFEPTKEFSNRFTVYHLWPLGHSSSYIKNLPFF